MGTWGGGAKCGEERNWSSCFTNASFRIPNTVLPIARSESGTQLQWVNEDLVDINATPVLSANRSEWRTTTRPIPRFQKGQDVKVRQGETFTAMVNCTSLAFEQSISRSSFEE